MSDISYTGYAWRKDGVWEAICIDLDISVQGSTFDEVYHGLTEAVADYVETVLDMSEEDRDRLLRRRVPFGVRLRIQIDYWASSIRNLWHNGDGGHGSFPVDTVTA